MKKIIAAVLCLTMCLALMSACGTENEPAVTDPAASGEPSAAPTESAGPEETGEPSEAPETETPAGEVIAMNAPACEGVKLTGKSCKVVQAVNLNAATKVVGVGRGFATEESLGSAKELAELLGAEMACTRPIAEEEKWMATERYIGVSGAMIKPALYIAAGISGQIQHMVGVNQSGTIIAINKDDHAPIFSACDYGIVGDVNTVIPMLIEKLKG